MCPKVGDRAGQILKEMNSLCWQLKKNDKSPPKKTKQHLTSEGGMKLSNHRSIYDFLWIERVFCKSQKNISLASEIIFIFL